MKHGFVSFLTLSSLAALLSITTLTSTAANAQWADDPQPPTPPPKAVKVSQKKFEAAVVKSLLKGEADLMGVATCYERCGNSTDEWPETSEVDYDKNGEPFVYQVPTAKKGELVAILTAEKNPVFLRKYFVLPLPHCRAFLSKLRAGRKPVTIGAEHYPLNVEFGLVSLGQNKVDAMDSLCEEGKEPGSGISRRFKFQSIVGPVVNFAQWSCDESEGMTHANCWVNWISWNLLETRRAELTDLFEKDSVLEALKADKVMRQRFFKGRRNELESATELAPIMKAIEDDPRQARERMGWQILSYNRRTHIANVHLGFFGDCCNSEKVFRIGLNLKVREDFFDLFAEAQTHGWLNLDPRKYSDKRKKAKFERAFSTYQPFTTK